MSKESLYRIGWFLPLRLAQYVVLFAVVVFWMNYPSYVQLQFILYSICTLVFTLLLAVGRRHELGAATAAVVGLQFLFEVVIESTIIFSTGSINSPFSALFVLTIVSAALVYRLLGTLIVASLVSTAYAFIIWMGLYGTDNPNLSVQALKTIFSNDDRAFYSILLHILIFYLVAFISGYLAERLKQRDRQLADTSLALKQARLETDDILRHLNSGLLTVDAAGSIIYFNRAAERILGYREEDVKGMHCEEVFAERMPRLAECLMDGIRDRLEHPRTEVEITSVAAERLPLGLSTSILTGPDHRMRGIIAIFSDLTDAKRLEAKVRTADRLAAVGELSASIAHEIRNPLAAISGSVEVLKQEIQVDGENEQLMDLIVKESDRLTKILTEFLTYARIDRGAYNKVELCHLVGDVVEILYHHPSFSERISVNIRSDDSVTYVVGDENLIKQLLLNLAVNTCESFDENKGNLTFRIVSQTENNRVVLYVSDDGPGISPELLKRIYEPFFSTKREGTGLGLSIVHRICTALKLKIDVLSRVGEGTTFVIEFAACLHHQPGEDTKSAASAASV
ncbi:MAG: PAS domain S-box protein [Candidatus Zixiibacteriota bacterium]|nr:MAG: PAS domain S-box protein [candidate division Zixibacteria bacterium]